MKHELRRSLSLPLLTLYGVGTMVGGGFYALLGEVAGRAGMLTPLAFACASLVAVFSALSFAELSARHPVSAGEARYVLVAFGSKHFSSAVAVLVILTGVVSAAALSRAIGGFLLELFGVPVAVAVLGVVLVLGLVAAWGITESVILAAVITVIEVGGLCYVVAVQGEHLTDVFGRWRELVIPDAGGWRGAFLGSFLAFYAFVGFEDMVNVAEEVQEPRRNLPRAILGALFLTTALYVIVATTAVLAVPLDELAESRTPLATLVAAQGEGARRTLGLISILAGVNGALVQIIMASRIVYGTTRHGEKLRWLAHVHPRTRTPVRATALITGVVVVLALWFPLVTLARATSTILLIVFALVNLALWVIQRRTPEYAEGPRFPHWVPAAGFLSCAAFLVLRILA